MPQIIRIVIYCDLVYISKWLLCPFSKNPFEIDKIRHRQHTISLRSGYKFYERSLPPPNGKLYIFNTIHAKNINTVCY